MLPYHIEKTDALDLLRSIPANTVDLILTDPAYESMEKYRKIGTTTRLKQSKSSSNEWFPIFPNNRFPAFFAECYRVLKKDRHVYILCDEETLFVVKPIGENAGFKYWKSIIWNKCAMGMGWHYRAQTERIAFFEKGKRAMNTRSTPDLLSFKRITNGYPTEKPVELLEVLIKESSQVGELILDPFCGSGSTGVAALRNSRRFLGGDVEEKALELAIANCHLAIANCHKETAGGRYE